MPNNLFENINEPELRSRSDVIECTASEALTDRSELAAAVQGLGSLIAHGARDLSAARQPAFRMLTEQIAATLHWAPCEELLSVGETARLHRVFAALVTWEVVSVGHENSWYVAIDPELYLGWQQQRAGAS